ncbi:MAG: ADP-ribosylglycohydrolase family protein [Lachnospiraceae bacterium]|nr:ADP-ribosylglycohydrolase family protein [Lachnospiraceae bacterium]
MSNIWLDGIMGVVVGDALGCPVQFTDREELKTGPVDDMEGYGTYNMPEGTWTDDSSMTIALLTSIQEKGTIDLEDIMKRFSKWLISGEYTPFGEAFDIGRGTMAAIMRYMVDRDIEICGGKTELDNGNGSLMRILPACLFAYIKKLPANEAVLLIHEVSGLTHNHLRAKIACGLYYFCTCSVLDNSGSLCDRLQIGMNNGFSFYENDLSNRVELAYYGRLRDLSLFSSTEEDSIKSTGHVVDTLEAAIWSLITTKSFEECELKAVNLGGDTDTIGAVAGGIAGLFYGYEAIPKAWLDVIKRREWLESICNVVISCS